MSITEQNFSSSAVIKNQQNFPLFIYKGECEAFKKIHKDRRSWSAIDFVIIYPPVLDEYSAE